MSKKNQILQAASLIAFVFSGAAIPAAAQAQQSQSMSEEDKSKDTDIVVTGTRRLDRPGLESAVPVDVFTAGDFRAQPSPQLQTILKTLVPSFNQTRTLLADGSAFSRPPTLRGLPGDQVLVLINGKRMHRSALVHVGGGPLNAGSQGADLSQISAPAVSRIEVLRDGAAAQYGSDAIAGVINIGLRRDAKGFEASARYGQTYRGDGEDTQLTAFWATGLGDSGGFFNITGEFIDQNIWDRAVERPEIAPLRAAGIITDFRNGSRLAAPENRAYRLVFNSEIPLGDTSFYAFGNYGWQRQGFDFNLRRPISVTAQAPIPGRPGTASLPRSVNPVFLDRAGFAPDGTALWDVNGRQFDANSQLPGFANGFVPFFEGTNEDLGLVGGFKGIERGINYDVSIMLGQNQIRYFLSDSLNASLGPATPTSFYLGKFVQREFSFNADFTTSADIGLAKPLFVAWGFEARRESYEVGLGDRPSWEIGTYASQWLAQCTLAGAPVSCATPGASAPSALLNANGSRRIATALPGSSGFQGFNPNSVVEGGRNNYSAYLDLEADLTERLQFGVAGRFDHFDDFGNTINGKLSARYAFNNTLALRGAVSTGFRAPTPGQQFTQNVTSGFPFGSVVPLGILTARVDSPVGQYYLAQPLRPEKSVSVSGGAVFTPSRRLTVTLDAYQIRVRDRIGTTGIINPAPDLADLLARGISEAAGLGAVRYFTNAFRTRTTGVDLVVAHNAETDLGHFDTRLAVNYNKTTVTDRTSITGTLGSGRSITLFPIDDVRKGNIEHLLPRWRAVLSQTFTRGPIDLTGRANYFGSFTSFLDPITSGFGPTPGVPTTGAAQALYPNPWTKRFNAQVSFDFEIGLALQDRYRIAIGAENLLGTFPERETRNVFPTTGGAANGGIYPDAPLGQQGGLWYARVSAKL
jgi:iron complex outermembrane recepter protein